MALGRGLNSNAGKRKVGASRRSIRTLVNSDRLRQDSRGHICIGNSQPATTRLGVHSNACTRIVISGYQPLNSDDQPSSSSGQITI